MDEYGTLAMQIDLDDGDLKVTTDFRSVYGELLHKVLQADSDQVLGNTHPELGLIA